MKNNITKKLTASMAVSMGIMSMAGSVAPIFAETAVSGEQADVTGLLGTITAAGVNEAGVTVKAYQLVDGYFDNNNLVKYVLTDPVNGAIADIEKPTTAEIVAIANNIGAGNFAGEVINMTDAGSGNFTADVEPGLYLILVSGSTDTVYNPALVAVNVTDANADAADRITSETVDLSKAFEVDGTSAYIKSSKSDMDKNIIGDDGADIGYGDTVKVGDVIHFKLDNMTIPSFSEDYENPVYKITDVLEGGKFSAISNIVVKVNNDVLPATDGSIVNYTLTQNANGFEISFSEEFLRAHAADAIRPSVEVTYDSALTAEAGVNYAENFNHAMIEYSNNPNDATSMKEIVKNTYHYSFAIDGLLDGEVADREETNEVNKVNEANAGYVDGTTAEGASTKKANKALAGATFTLYADEDLTEIIGTDISDDNGHYSFSGLDEGIYYLKETEAPAGYAINDNIYKITIAATLDDATGIMSEYSIVTQVKTVNSSVWEDAGSAVYTNDLNNVNIADDGSVENSLTSVVTPMEVVNSRLQTMPSTGGAGTAMAFAISAGLAATTGGIVVTAKKKSRK
jgi:hypothetical protein